MMASTEMKSPTRHETHARMRTSPSRPGDLLLISPRSTGAQDADLVLTLIEPARRNHWLANRIRGVTCTALVTSLLAYLSNSSR